MGNDSCLILVEAPRFVKDACRFVVIARERMSGFESLRKETREVCKVEGAGEEPRPGLRI